MTTHSLNTAHQALYNAQSIGDRDYVTYHCAEKVLRSLRDSISRRGKTFKDLLQDLVGSHFVNVDPKNRRVYVLFSNSLQSAQTSPKSKHRRPDVYEQLRRKEDAQSPCSDSENSPTCFAAGED